MITRELASWIEAGIADDAVATASRAAPPGGIAHYVTSVSGSYSAPAVGELILREGASEIARWQVHDQLAASLPSPVKVASGKSVSLELAASGGVGNVGAVNLAGYTA